jgi:hypothetical protein
MCIFLNEKNIFNRQKASIIIPNEKKVMVISRSKIFLHYVIVFVFSNNK